ncbi:MAG: putative DNA binding domain-containing protein [Candidatus Hydrogenedentes bacterium]|nr:putative DNA binding domain-containing protein [Candidatus Hydrogenedentota bacterium]
MMTNAEVLDKLRDLLGNPHESECLEFKEARSSFSSEEMGKYFSALSNEANLSGESSAWLVFGVIDKSRTVCGSQYRADPVSLHSLKHEVAQFTGGVTFKTIYTTLCDEKRVILFEIPPASTGIPTPYKGHYYGRDGESLVPLSLQKMERIRRGDVPLDWSGEICPNATLEDLDDTALQLARSYFREKNKYKEFSKDTEEWSDAEFLEKCRLTKAGKITRACILLLGRFESAFHLEPAVAQITWKLEGEQRAYEHFGPPFLRTTTELYARVRNPIQKMESPSELIPYEFPVYEKSVILEALHNAVAHQDYGSVK